jgi:cytochrome P450/NADPH-cytochrome P450 reductase
MAHVDPKDTVPIPQPPGYPIIGNVSDIDLQDLPTSLLRLARQYGK